MARARRGSTLADVVLSGGLPNTQVVPVPALRSIGDIIGLDVTGAIGSRAVDSTKLALTQEANWRSTDLVITGDTLWHNVASFGLVLPPGPECVFVFASTPWVLNAVGTVSFQISMGDAIGTVINLSQVAGLTCPAVNAKQQFHTSIGYSASNLLTIQPGQCGIVLYAALGNAANTLTFPGATDTCALHAFVAGDNS